VAALLTTAGLAAAGFVAGGMNALAGGGSFVSLPALILAGLPSVAANASSTVALLPGAVASVWAFRRDLDSPGPVSLRLLGAVSLVGGLAGAVLLLATPAAAFDAVLPWLLLAATLAFAFGRQAGAALRRRVRIGRGALLAAQFVLGVYGGYFGGAVGIMMMAAWTLLGEANLKAVTPARMLLVGLTNTVASLCFVLAGAVWWGRTLPLLAGAVLGGYGGARLALLLSARQMRAIVIGVTSAMTLVFFWRAYG